MNKVMHRRYTVAGVAAAISDTEEAKDSETEGMLVVQNEQEEESEIKEVISDVEEEVSAVDFVDEARSQSRPKMILKKTKRFLNVFCFTFW